MRPTITGAAVRTSTLTAAAGGWNGAGNTYAYQWQQDLGAGFIDIVGATGTTYVLGVPDVGKRVRVRVTAANAWGYESGSGTSRVPDTSEAICVKIVFSSPGPGLL